MPKDNTFLLFTLEGHYFALYISEVIRVYPAMEIEKLCEGPEILKGLFTLSGKKIPVLDLRQRLHLPERNLEPENAMVVGLSSNQEIAFFVDAVVGVHSFADEKINRSSVIYPEMADYVSAVTEFAGHTVWVYKLDALFTEQDFLALTSIAGDNRA